MFTGIVEEIGTVDAIRRSADSIQVDIRGQLVTTDVAVGDSIAVSGVCLTAVVLTGQVFTADVMQETLERSTLGALQSGDRVNLERAATLQSRLGGHLVQGHVDARVTVLDRRSSERWDVVRVSLPASVARYVVEKGSVCLDGTSLTVSGLGPDWFEVSLIPETLRATTLGSRSLGDLLNLEVDVIAKHIERLLAGRTP